MKVGDRVKVRDSLSIFANRSGRIVNLFEDDSVYDWVVELDGDPNVVCFRESELELAEMDARERLAVYVEDLVTAISQAEHDCDLWMAKSCSTASQVLILAMEDWQPSWIKLLEDMVLIAGDSTDNRRRFQEVMREAAGYLRAALEVDQ